MQQKAEIQNLKLQDYLETSNSFCQDLLAYKPEQTSLIQIPNSKWNEFSTQRGLNPNSSGIYLPRNQTAVVRNKNPLSLFHEYFGHGLYCEQSLSGRKLIDLEKKLLEEEKQEFSKGKFTLKDIQNFREENKTFQNLDEFRKHNLLQYETFAIWTEYLLSGEHRLKDLFGRRYDSFSVEDRKVIDDVINFSESYGNLATFYKFGLGKVQSKERLLKLSRELFNSKLDKTNLILHFGSGKPFSDIDLFVISDDIKSFYCNWLDISAYKIEEVEEKIKTLDSRITNPIFVGNVVFGEEEYLQKLRKKILEQPITKEAIKYNFKMAEYSKKRYLDSSLGRNLQDKNLRSSKIYLANAISLKNGDKLLTYKNIKDYTQKRFSHSEKFVELKGGTEKECN